MIPEKEFPRLRVEKLLNPENGEVTLNYFWDDQAIPKVRLTGRRAGRLAGLTLIQKDLKNCANWMAKASELAKTLKGDTEAQFTRFEDRDVADQVKGLFVAALTFYGKAFTEAAGRRMQIPRDWLHESFRETHDFYMKFRHNMAAHSGDEKLEHAESDMVLLPKSSGSHSPIQIYTYRLQPDIVWSNDDAGTFTALIDHVLEKVQSKSDELGKQIFDASMLKGAPFWQAAAAAGTSVDVDSLFSRETSEADDAKAVASWLPATSRLHRFGGRRPRKR